MKLNTQRVSTQRDLHWDTVNQGLKIKDKEKFESRKRKRPITNKEIPKRLSANLSRSLAVQKRMGYSKQPRKKSVNQAYFISAKLSFRNERYRKRLSPEIIKKLLTELKTKVDSSEIIVGDFSTALSTTNRSSRQKINMKIKYLN